MTAIKTAIVKNANGGFFLNGSFNGLTYQVGTSSGGIVRLFPTDVGLKPMEIDLATLTILDTGGTDITPVGEQEKAALLNSVVSKKKIDVAGQSVLQAPNQTPLPDAGQPPVPIVGIFSDDDENSSVFETLVDGSLIYKGLLRKALWLGSGAVSVNLPCEITYRLYRNGAQLGDAFTPLGFQNSNVVSTISENRLIDINYGDIFRLYAEADSNNITLSTVTLSMVIKS